MKKSIVLLLILGIIALFVGVLPASASSSPIIQEEVFSGEYDSGVHDGMANIVFGQVDVSATSYGIVIADRRGVEKIFPAKVKGSSGKFGVAVYLVPDGKYTAKIYSGEGDSRSYSSEVEFYANGVVPAYEYEVVNDVAMITTYKGEEKEVVIPDELDGYTVKYIGYGAFENSDIQSVRIPQTVTVIYDDAFRGCDSLDSLTFDGDGLTTIGDSAFRGCSSLGLVILPPSVTSVGDYCFYGAPQSGFSSVYSRGLSDKEYYVPKFVYEFLGEDVMPMMTTSEMQTRMLNADQTAYLDNMGVSDPTYGVGLDQSVKNTLDSGLNVILSASLNNLSRGGEYDRVYELLEQYGGVMLYKDYAMRSFVPQNASTNATLAYYTNTLSKYPAFGGINVADEPGYASWEDEYEGQVATTVGKLGYLDDGQAYWRDLFPRRLFFVNTLQTYAPDWAFSNGYFNDAGLPANADYNYYYRSYIENVKPQVLSFDYYPCVHDGTKLLKGHFEQLYLGHYYANEYYKEYHDTRVGIPLSVVIQVSGWGGRRPANGASYTDMAWQINTALAFGAKSMAFFGYYGGDYMTIGTVLDQYGRPTAKYQDFKKLTGDTQAMAKWLLNAEVDHIYTKGAMPNNYLENGSVVSAESFPTEMKVVRDEDFGWRFTSSSGVNNLVSHMKYCVNNNEYIEGVPAKYQELYFVCNNTVRRSGDITVNFSEAVTGSYIYGGEQKTFSGTSLTVATNAGEGFAILLNK